MERKYRIRDFPNNVKEESFYKTLKYTWKNSTPLRGIATVLVVGGLALAAWLNGPETDYTTVQKGPKKSGWNAENDELLETHQKLKLQMEQETEDLILESEVPEDYGMDE